MLRAQDITAGDTLYDREFDELMLVLRVRPDPRGDQVSVVSEDGLYSTMLLRMFPDLENYGAG